jgi:hypothetical protein
MPTRPFFVQRNGDCIPLEGEWRVECLEGAWYVLGHHDLVACDSERAAYALVAEFAARSQPDLLALEAIESLDAVHLSNEVELTAEFELG